MKSNICAIVVTYNRKELLRECIEALLASREPSDILIVDNYSTDGTKEVCDAFLSEVNNKTDILYYNTGANLGGAGGFNLGLKKAYEIGYEFFWLMDDDTIVEENTLTELFLAQKNICGMGKTFGFLSSNAYWTDGSICKMNSYTISSDWDLFRHYTLEGVIKVDRATFPDERHYRFDDIHLEKIDICQFL